MNNTKKIISALIALSITMGSTVLADIPKYTVVIGNKAYNINYANDKKNLKEIMYEVANRKSDIYIKGIDGKWYQNNSGEEVPNYVIPAVTYKDIEGNLTDYDQEDGEEITLNIDEANFISSNQIKIKFNKRVSEESAVNKANYKIGGKALEDKDKISLQKDGQAVIITLNKNLAAKNIQSNIYVSENVMDLNGDTIEGKYERNVLIINSKESVEDKVINRDVNIITSEYSLNNVKVKGNIYVNGDNVAVEDTEVTKNIILDPGKEGNPKLLNVKSDKVIIKSGGENGVNLSKLYTNLLDVKSERKVRVVSKNRSKIKTTSIKSNTILDSISGTFGEIIVDINNEVYGREVILNGQFKEAIVIKRGVKLTASKNSVIAMVKIATRYMDNSITLDGKFDDVEITEKSILKLEKNAEIKQLSAKADITLNGDKTVKVYKVMADKDVNVNIDKSAEDKGFIIPKVNSEENNVTPYIPPSTSPTVPSNVEYKPTASNVSINGTLKVGDTLRGDYQYSDKDGDKEGSSEYRWYRADDENGTNKIGIQGANNITYRLTSYDEEKYISFEVMPVAKTGKKEGVSKMSKFVGPVKAQKKIDDGIVSIDINGYNLNITVESPNLYNNVNIRILDKHTGRECFFHEGKPVDNRVRFNTKLLSNGEYKVIINAYGPGKELISKTINIY